MEKAPQVQVPSINTSISTAVETELTPRSQPDVCKERETQRDGEGCCQGFQGQTV